MKFIVKWNNGYWKVFDTQEYRDVSMHGLKTDADKACLATAIINLGEIQCQMKKKF